MDSLTQNGGYYASSAIEELKALPQWVAWRSEPVEGRDKPAKVPYDPKTGRRASSTDPETWGSYEEARAYANRTGGGVGFVFTEGDPYCGIDLDGAVVDGEVQPWAREIVTALDSYTEYSVSGTGLHVLVEAVLPDASRHKGAGVELYDRERFFVFTGQHLDGTPETIEPRQAEIDGLYGELFGSARAGRPTAEPIPESIPTREEALSRWGRKVSPEVRALLDKPCEKDRSKQLYRFHMGLFRCGLWPDEALPLSRNCAYDKWAGNDQALWLDVRRAWGDFLQENSPFPDLIPCLFIIQGVSTDGTIEYELRLDNRPQCWSHTVVRCPGAGTTALELLSKELPPVRYVVHGLLPEGAGTLAGPPKIGKSWWALDLSLSVRTGKPFLDHWEVEQGEVLYLALEDNERRLKKRLRKLTHGWGPEATQALSGLHLYYSWPRLNDGGYEKLDRWLFEHSDTRLVVLDTWPKIKAKAGRRNAYDEDYLSIDPIQRLAFDHRVTILVLLHLRKQPAEDILETVQGSMGVTGALDTTMVLRRTRGTCDARLYVTGRDIEEELDLALAWSPQTVRWSVLGDADELEQSKERAEVLRAVDLGLHTVSDIAGVVEKKTETVRHLVWKMIKDGQLMMVGRGYYARPAK